MNERTMKNDLSWNDPWSDHPKTQFRPTYPFFRNPNPGLHYVPKKSIWIEHGYIRLKRFFLGKFSSKIILINQPLIWDEFWIFECIMGQSKKNEWKEKCNSRVKILKGQSRAKMKRIQSLMGGANKKIKG